MRIQLPGSPSPGRPRRALALGASSRHPQRPSRTRQPRRAATHIRSRHSPCTGPALAVAVTAVLAACVDDPAGPAPGRRAAPAVNVVSPTAGRPVLTSATVKYRDAGLKPTSNRSGAATLTARALRAKGGETLLEVSTGALDQGATAPGNLDKIQVKEFEPGGALVNTTNYTKLRSGGYASYGVTALPPGGFVQVQANVSGIDPTRTDVVTVTDRVKLRPDLAVTALEAPAEALPNVPVSIAATLSERNGDVGARSNCVLYVDGAEADRAGGIWIDAGDVVTCAFTHTFTSAGTKQLEVVLEDVVPGDWDAANNRATRAVAVEAQQDFSYSASATAENRRTSYFYEYLYFYTDPTLGAVTERHENTVTAQVRNDYHLAYHHGSMPTEAAWPLKSIEVEHASNGAILAATAVTDPATSYTIDDGAGTGYSCAVASAEGPGGRIWAQACAGRYFAWWGDQQWHAWTDFNHHRFAGTVLYASEAFWRFWYRPPGGEPYESSWTGNCYSGCGSDAAGDGPPATLGATYTMRFALTDRAGTTYRRTAEVPLTRVDPVADWGWPSNPWGQPRTCTSNTEGGWTSSVCQEWEEYYALASGSTSGEPTVVAAAP